jgi:glyoxylase-like metal-dependent hydrolase (beta-lactamase superfamily II)
MSDSTSSEQVIYRQINKDYAYWIEKRRLGQMKGGHVCGLLTHVVEGRVQQNLLFDAGLGTIEGIADHCDDAFWDQPLQIFITHGHIDHHAELMVLSEIYCQRRGEHWRDVRPPLPVYATAGTQRHLDRTHYWGYRDGATLRHEPLTEGRPLQRGIFTIRSLPVDHFPGAVIFTVEFELRRRHKILIGWDLLTIPQAECELAPLRGPSLAFLDATTWSMPEVGHPSIEDLVQTGFVRELSLCYEPQKEQYGAYLVHYSGWEDPGGMLSDDQLKEKFDRTFPAVADLVRVARRGQTWSFT